MRKSAVACVLGLLTLAGCAEDLPAVRWSKPGATFDEFMQAREACADQVREQSRPFFVAGQRYAGRPDAVDSGLFIPCMADHGFHQDPKGFAAPSSDAFALFP